MEVRRSQHGKAALVISGNNIIKILMIHGNGPRFEYVPRQEFKREYKTILKMSVEDALFSFLKVAKRAYKHNPEVLLFIWSEIMKNLSEYTLAELVLYYNKIANSLGAPHRKSFESKAAAMEAISKLDDSVKSPTLLQTENEERSTTRSNKMTETVNEAGNVVVAEKKPRGKGIGARAKELILEGKSTEEVISTIKSEIEGANPTPATIAWYKNKLRQEGLLARPERKAKDKANAEEGSEEGSEEEAA